MTTIRSLSGFVGGGYDKGRPMIIQAAWLAASTLIVEKRICPMKLRISILRLFGASIGDGVRIRDGVRIHWPWKLTIGDDVWIGVDAWLLNLEPITLESDVCISQGVLLCTGSHDWRSPTFEYDNAPIVIREGAWVAARATVLRGVTVGRGALVGATALINRDVPDFAHVHAPAAVDRADDRTHGAAGQRRRIAS